LEEIVAWEVFLESRAEAPLRPLIPGSGVFSVTT
jgi:hypothetical protein